MQDGRPILLAAHDFPVNFLHLYQNEILTISDYCRSTCRSLGANADPDGFKLALERVLERLKDTPNCIA